MVRQYKGNIIANIHIKETNEDKKRFIVKTMESTKGESSTLGYKFGGVSIEDGKSKPVISTDGLFGRRDMIKVVLLVTTLTLSCLLFYKSANNPLNVVSLWKTDCYSSKTINETSLTVSILHMFIDNLNTTI